jgi:pilus assembly protein CpaC
MKHLFQDHTNKDLPPSWHADNIILGMLKGLILCAIIISIMAFPAAAQGVINISSSGPSASITVAKGKPQTIEISESFSEIVIGDTEIADVTPMTDSSFVVLGKEVGTTGIALFDANKALVGTIDLEISYDTNRLKQALNSKLPGQNVHVSSANGQIILSGKVKDAQSADRAAQIAEKFGEDIINSMSVNAVQQVQLEVRFLEANRNAAKDLGVNISAFNGANRGLRTGAATLESTNAPFGTLLTRLITRGYTIDTIINALEQKGTARRLAEPNLVALSGQRASFLAGGEFPFPVPSSDGTITIEFKRFGVGLEFTPTVLDDNRIHLQIAPEVSEIDPTRSVELANIEVPGLTVRRAETAIELRDGQSFVIAGLLQSISTNTQSRLPWLGDVPVLGALFRSVAYQKQETDLVIVVTPRLVEPMSTEQLVSSPLDGARPANDADLFLMGKGEVNKSLTRKVAFTRRDGVLPTGHIIDLARK